MNLMGKSMVSGLDFPLNQSIEMGKNMIEHMRSSMGKIWLKLKPHGG